MKSGYDVGAAGEQQVHEKSVLASMRRFNILCLQMPLSCPEQFLAPLI
jgi:hypothetical protein